MWAAQKADVMASHLDSTSVAETACWMVDLTAAHLVLRMVDLMALHLVSTSVAETAYWMVDLTAAHLASRMAETSAKQRAD